MHKEKNKYDYGTLLAPPIGYELTKAIGTTYSLDLKALLSVPISFHFRASMDPELVKDPIALFLSLKDTTKKIDVFCQLGGIHDNVKSEKLYRFVEGCIHQINLPNGKSFHPKIWIVRYDHKSKPAIYKIIVLSRNLTFDCSWDMIVGLEGEVHPTLFNIDKKTNQPVADFINFLYKTINIPPPESFLKDMFRVSFRPIGDVDYSEVTFIPLGIDKKKNNIPFIFENLKSNPWKEILITSPFAANSIIRRIKQNTTKLYLISRQQTLESLNQEMLKDVFCYHINEKIVTGSSYQESEDEVETSSNDIERVKLYDLHAKTYLLVRDWDYELLIGSGNATESAFAGNVEFMMKIKGRTSKPVDKFKEAFFTETNDFLIDYTPDPSLRPTKKDENEIIVEKAMKQFLIQLDQIHIEAYVQAQNLFRLILDIDPPIVLPDGCSVFIRPFHLSVDHNQGMQLPVKQIIFDSIEIADLSVFFIVKVVHLESGTEQRCIIKLPIDNLPDNRVEWVVLSLFGNKKDFFKLLRMLLYGDLIDILLGKDDGEGNKEGKAWRFLPGFDAPLFELMLKAASREPRKLEEIKRVLTYVMNDDVKSELKLDDDILKFLELWKHFEQYLPK